MSVVSFVHENDNPISAELTLGFFSLVKKRLNICKLVDPDWWCFPRLKYSVFLVKFYFIL